MLAITELSCISHRFSGEMRILSGSSATKRSPFQKFKKTPVKVLQGLVQANSHVFTELEDSEESPKGAYLH